MPQHQTMSEERKLCKYCKYFVSLYEYRKHNGMHEVCENESTPLQSDWEAEFEALWNDNFVTGGLARFIQQREEIKTFIRNLYTSKVQEAEKLSIYCEHDRDCIRSQLSQGRPTRYGGYEEMYNGKWYQAKPDDLTPKCDCGLSELLATFSTHQETNPK